jgi:hypothetical protein
VEILAYNGGGFPCSLQILTFEQGSRLRRIEGAPRFPGALYLPASLEYIDGRTYAPDQQDEPPDLPATWFLEPGNRHLTFVDGTLMNVSKTSVIRYFDMSGGTPLDPAVEELGAGSFFGLGISTFAFPEPSRLRSIGEQAFARCAMLGCIMIPSTVEVIGSWAFQDCRMLQEVRIATGSRLRLIGKGAFDDCEYLQPVDVPSSAKIRARFKVLARAYDEAGSLRVRVWFMQESVEPFRLMAC